MRKKFEFLEHTADAYIAAYGSSLVEAFENAALATMEVMTDTEKVKPEIEEEITVEASDEYALLYNWLEELIILFDTEGYILSRFQISSIEEKQGFRLNAKVWGESFDPKRHPQRVGVKAVTYHLMEIIQKPKKVTVRFILDV